jgi:UDP-N-acetylglucosamine--N-acetylmuramyl-(pentapeptide) pyrophosphoryl-undecaprenol N-acetylglucosamine transferase
LPAILVPYPYAWRYQRVNASYLVKRGAAVQLDDAQLASEIVPRVTGLIADHEKLEKMSEAMRSLNKPDAAMKIAELLNEMASSNPRGSALKATELVE